MSYRTVQGITKGEVTWHKNVNVGALQPQQQVLSGLWVGLFTIAFANLVWWKIILGIVVWPYFLGLAVR